MTLYTILVEFCKVCAPFIPFMTEQIYQNLVISTDKSAPMSIHLCDYPAPRAEFDFPEIEEDMDAIRKIVMLGRACRNDASIKNRQPLAKIFVQSDKSINDKYTYIILDELNVKAVEFTDNADEFISYKFKPQMKTMGPKYGRLMKPIFEELNKHDGGKVMAVLSAGETISLEVEGTPVTLERGDVLVETEKKGGFVSGSDGGFTVVLDTNLTDALIEEGFVREIISKLQTMRKDSGFEVQDNIKIVFKAGEKLSGIIERNKAEIAAQTLAVDVSEGTDAEFKDWNINGESLSVYVEKV